MNTIKNAPPIAGQTGSYLLPPQPSSVEHQKISVKQLSNQDLMVNIQHATGNSPEQCDQANDGTPGKVAVTADKRLENSLDYPLKSSKIPEKTPETEVLSVKKEQLLLPLMIRSENPDHLVKRDNWVPYGDPDVFNSEFRLFVDRIKDKIIKKDITSEDLIKKAIDTRKNIEITRENGCADEFGLLRNNPETMSRYSIFCTHTPLGSNYSFAKPRAVALTHNKFFINHKTKAGEIFIKYVSEKCKPDPIKVGDIHYGVVVGNAGDNKVYLTQIVTSPRIGERRMLHFFGAGCDHYVGKDNRSALIIHTDPDQLNPGLQHVQGLIDQAMAGDLSVIPRIHWWYVHLAPTVRGPGGTAEMIIHALCAARGYYLPGWAEDIAPSFEVLVEPNEDAFCQNYHQLFETHQRALQMLFTKRSQ